MHDMTAVGFGVPCEYESHRGSDATTGPNHPHPDLPRPHLHGLALFLTRERHRPELISVALGVPLGVEADLIRGQHPALDGVDLTDKLSP